MHKMRDILSRVADFTIFLALVTDPAGECMAGPAGAGRTGLLVAFKAWKCYKETIVIKVVTILIFHVELIVEICNNCKLQAQADNN